jgi:hypothetical protein
MPIIRKHHVHPYSKDLQLGRRSRLPLPRTGNRLVHQHLPHACFRRTSPQRFWFRGLWQKPGQRFAVCGGNPAALASPTYEECANDSFAQPAGRNARFEFGDPLLQRLAMQGGACWPSEHQLCRQLASGRIDFRHILTAPQRRLHGWA